LTKTAELRQADSEIRQTAQPYGAPPATPARFHLDVLDYATIITLLFGIGGIVYSFLRHQ
jgi:hypothetical protein